MRRLHQATVGRDAATHVREAGLLSMAMAIGVMLLVLLLLGIGERRWS
jgi:hypothetical protein